MKSIPINGMLKLIITMIVAQTLYFKFNGSLEMVYVFTVLEIEPFGRFLSAIMEVMACSLLFFRPTRLLGAFITMFLMLVAILAHLCVLGIEVRDDSGAMFALALLTFLCSSVLIYRFRDDCNFLCTNNLEV